VGEYKVAALARRLRVITPCLEVAALPSRIEDVPMGALRSDLFLACVDTRMARQTINEIAWRLRTPWIDSGVLASEQLARINVYVPGVDTVCLECSWDAGDYAALETEFPCGGAVSAEQSSDTSAELASLAASLVAIECRKMLSGDLQHAAVGRQVTVDARTHRLLSTSFGRNPACRFDHKSFELEFLRCSPRRLTVGEAIAITGRLRVAGHHFARQLICPKCAYRLLGLRLNRPKQRCPQCGARMIAPGFDALLEHLDASLPPEDLSRSLARVGLCAGDVVYGNDKQFELVAEVL
jgi:hypothetical protein